MQQPEKENVPLPRDASNQFSNQYSSHDRRQQHQNRWLSNIYPTYGINIQRNKAQPCPACSGVDRFSCDDKNGTGRYYCRGCGPGDGYTLLMKLYGCSFPEALDLADEAIGGCAARLNFFPGPPQTRQPCVENQTDLPRLLRGAVEPTGTPVQKYLESRGLPLGANLLFHPNWTYKDEFSAQTRSPAMVALIHNLQNELVGLHATILTHQGAKRLDSQGRKQTRYRNAYPGALRGSAIQLYPAEPVLGLGEGVETSYSLGVLCDIPVWACGDAGKLAVVQLPDIVKRVFVAVDNDPAGKRAGAVLSSRLVAEGRTVTLVHAEKLGLPEKGDLADFLKVAQAG